MKNIFLLDSLATPGTEKILNSDFKAHYPDVNRNMSWAEVQPYIRQATRESVMPYIGELFYDDMATKAITGTLVGVEIEFVERLKDAIAHYTIAKALPKKKTIVASMGAVENVATENTTASSQWGFRTTLFSVTKDADLQLDIALQYLEENQDNPSFSGWKTSKAFSKGRHKLFRNTSEFQEYQNINSSRRTYLAMLPSIQYSMGMYIMPLVGKTTMELLFSEKEAGLFTGLNDELLKMVQAPLAAWSVFHAADRLSIITSEEGFRTISNADAIDTRALPTQAIQEKTDRLKYRAEEDARHLTAELAAYMQNNKGSFPGYANDFVETGDCSDYRGISTGGDFGAIGLF